MGALSSGGTCSVPSSLSLNGWGAFYHQFLRKHNLLDMFASLGIFFDSFKGLASHLKRCRMQEQRHERISE